MGDDKMTTCAVHGSQEETFVCSHIASGLRTGERVGFHSAQDDLDIQRPDSWCDDCERRFQAAGGEWSTEVEAQAKITILCGACYDRAKLLHLGGVA